MCTVAGKAGDHIALAAWQKVVPGRIGWVTLAAIATTGPFVHHRAAATRARKSPKNIRMANNRPLDEHPGRRRRVGKQPEAGALATEYAEVEQARSELRGAEHAEEKPSTWRLLAPKTGRGSSPAPAKPVKGELRRRKDNASESVAPSLRRLLADPAPHFHWDRRPGAFLVAPIQRFIALLRTELLIFCGAVAQTA